MNLAIVSPFPPEISGVGQYGARVARGLAATGAFDSITVIANCAWLSHAALERDGDGLDVRRVWARDWAGSVPAILKSLARLRPDVVWFNFGLSIFGHSRWANAAGLTTPLLARTCGLRAVVTLHEIFEAARLRDLGAVNGRLTHLGGRAVTRLILRADAVILTMNSYVAEIRRRYGAANLVHLPHGTFDTPEFLPLPNPCREILMFASHAPYKGLPVLLEAFAQMQARDSDLRLTIAGGNHPRFPGYLETVRQTDGALPNITWAGPVSEEEIRTLFGRASVIALPYTATTGASSVIHRAATYGRPVVVSDLPDVRAIAEEEGLWLEYVPPNDSAALARALETLLADRPKREALGRHNLAALQKMTLADTCAAYVELFKQATKK